MKNIYICYLCFSEDTKFIGRNLDFDTDIFVCNDCGLIQNYYVSNHYLSHYYRKTYRQERKETIGAAYLEFMSLRAESQFEFIKKKVSELTEVKRVLDIGAGAGLLLKKFIPTAEVFAVESDEAMAEYMEKVDGIEVVDETVIFNEDNHSKFDLVILSHVFEHVNNPLEYLYQLHKIVSANGTIFMEVPNEPICLVANQVKKKKKGIGHLFDYTVETLNLMVRKSHLFEITELSTFSVSVQDYIDGASVANFNENVRGDGIHIRCLLRKLKVASLNQEYHYIDAVFQGRDRDKLVSEKRLDAALVELESLKSLLSNIKNHLG